MRRIIGVFIVILCCYQMQAQKPKVVASASIFADMTEEVAKGLVEVSSIVPLGGDPHLHEPTPRDAKLVAGADIILMNGLTFEGWIQSLVENSGTKAKSYLITEGVDAITSKTYKNATDPHAWMDASNGMIYVKNIEKALSELMPENAEQFKANAAAYSLKLEELDKEIMEQIKSIPEKQRILITSHDAFEYYGKRYGLKLESMMGISTEAEVRTSDIMRVTKSIRDNNVPAIFVESTINPKGLQQIAKDTGVKIGGELYADSLGDKAHGAETYYKMLKQNTAVIVAGLKGLSENHVHRTDSKEGSGMTYLILGAILIFSTLFFIIKLNK